MLSNLDLDIYLPDKSGEQLKNIRNSKMYLAFKEQIKAGHPDGLDNLVEYVGEIMYRAGMRESFAIAATVTKLVDDGDERYQSLYKDLLQEVVS